MRQFTVNSLPYFPIIGLGLYVIAFVVAASLYPGGSYNHPLESGYSFFHNFLCDTMNPITHGGSQNNARLIAIIAHMILSFTMISFFLILPHIFNVKNRNTHMIGSFGVASMTVFIFMYTEYHDLMVTLTGIIGTFAFIPLFVELKNYHNKPLKKMAYLCFSLSFLVFLIFQTKIGFYYLPFLQKITFIIDAIWVVWSCITVLNSNKRLIQVPASMKSKHK